MSGVPGPRSHSLRRNAIVNVAGRSLSTLLWIAVTPFTLSHLGAERFAVWSLFFLFGGYVGALDFGMANGVARYVALFAARRDRTNVRLVIRRSLLLAAALGLMWCVVCVLLRGAMLQAFHVPAALAQEVLTAFAVFALSMLVSQVAQVLNGVLTGYQRLDYSNLCFTSGLFVHAAVLIAGLANHGGLVVAAAAMMCGHLVNVTLAALFVRQAVHATPDGISGTPGTWRELLHFGGAVQATTAFAVAHTQVAKIMLATLGTLVLVTRFELGFRVANAVWTLPQLVLTAVIPAAAHASADGRDALRGIYEWTCRWLLALGGFVLAGLWLLAPALMVLWLGPGHDESVGVARQLAIAFAIANPFLPATAVARGGGWPWLESGMFVVAFALNVTIQWFGIPRWGLAGASIAVAVSYILAGTGMLAMLHPRLKVDTMRWVLRTVLPRLVLPAAATALLAWWWPVGIPATKTAALLLLFAQGACYTALATLLMLPTGDPQAVFALLRLQLGRRTAATGVGAEGVS